MVDYPAAELITRGYEDKTKSGFPVKRYSFGMLEMRFKIWLFNIAMENPL